ncbi:unnamed protein product [Ectocarpus sp. 13 AM-2016]
MSATPADLSTHRSLNHSLGALPCPASRRKVSSSRLRCAVAPFWPCQQQEDRRFLLGLPACRYSSSPLVCCGGDDATQTRSPISIYPSFLVARRVPRDSHKNRVLREGYHNNKIKITRRWIDGSLSLDLLLVEYSKWQQQVISRCRLATDRG